MSSTTQPSPEEGTAVAAAAAAEQQTQQPPVHVDWLQSVELGYDVGGGGANEPPETPRCFRCGTPLYGKILRCGKCRVACYCQKDCQVNDWKAGKHKTYCAAYERVGPHMSIRDGDDKARARTDVFAKVRMYACPYASHRARTLGRGFLFLQSDGTLAAMSLPVPKDSYGRTLSSAPHHRRRSVVLHYLTVGEYDSEVCRDDFELAIVRTQLVGAVDDYDEDKEIVLLTRFRCGNLAVGRTPIVPSIEVCRKIGLDYFGNATGEVQLFIDDDG